MAKPNSKEWPLVVFTVGLQLAAGIAIVSAFEGRRSFESQRNLTAAMLTALLLAISGSLFHLGRPVSGWRALTNVRSSRLTAELLTCIVFLGLSLSKLLLLQLFGYRSGPLNIAIAFAGLAAVLISATIYTLPSQPLWYSLSTPSSFVGATLLLGGVVELAFAAGETGRLSLGLMFVGGLLTVLSGAAMILRVLGLSASRYRAPEARPVMAFRHWVSCAIFFLGTGLPVLFAFVGFPVRSIAASVAILIFATVGIAFGRTLMYSRGLAISHF